MAPSSRPQGIAVRALKHWLGRLKLIRRDALEVTGFLPRPAASSLARRRLSHRILRRFDDARVMPELASLSLLSQ